MQFHHKELPKAMPLGDDQFQRCFWIDLFGQQSNREPIDNAKVGSLDLPSWEDLRISGSSGSNQAADKRTKKILLPK